MVCRRLVEHNANILTKFGKTLGALSLPFLFFERMGLRNFIPKIIVN
jgi:hypothetical protein